MYLFIFIWSHLLVLTLGSTLHVFSSESLFLYQWVQHYTSSLLLDSVYLILRGDFAEFGLNFVQEDRYKSIFFILQVVIQVYQHHFLKILSFSQCVFLASLPNIWSPWVCITFGFCFVAIPCCFHCYSFIV